MDFSNPVNLVISAVGALLMMAIGWLITRGRGEVLKVSNEMIREFLSRVMEAARVLVKDMAEEWIDDSLEAGGDGKITAKEWATIANNAKANLKKAVRAWPAIGKAVAGLGGMDKVDLIIDEKVDQVAVPEIRAALRQEKRVMAAAGVIQPGKPRQG